MDIKILPLIDISMSLDEVFEFVGKHWEKVHASEAFHLSNIVIVDITFFLSRFVFHNKTKCLGFVF